MSRTYKALIGTLIVELFGIFFIVYMPAFSSSRDRIDYFILMISFLYIPLLYVFLYLKHKIDLFEPINMFFILYFLMYTITPLVLIIQDNTLCFGTDVMDGCFKATVIYMISLTLFCFAYYSRFTSTSLLNNVRTPKPQDKIVVTYNNQNVVIIAVLGWLLCYVITLFFLFKTGRSLSYILTLGFRGEKTSASELSVNFLENISYGMSTFWLYICNTSKSKMLKFGIGFLTVTAYLIRGFRFVIVIMLVAYFIMYYTKKGKKPKIRQCLFLLSLLLVMITVVGFMRNDLRTGVETNWTEFGFKTLTYSLYSNFNIYQVYYGITNALPMKHTFGGFQIWFENAAVFIPRIIWKSKPLAEYMLNIRLIAVAVNDYAIFHAAMATPDLGSYYMQFGTFGCVIYSFAWGKLCKKMKLIFNRKKANLHVLIAYSIFVPSLLQTIIRGGDVFSILRKIGFFFVPVLVMIIAERCGYITKTRKR